MRSKLRSGAKRNTVCFREPTGVPAHEVVHGKLGRMVTHERIALLAQKSRISDV